jgi:hypothetical protein
MNMNLENNIKQSLKNFEMPYDQKAWEALSQKLDAKMPVSNKSFRKFNYKFVAVTGVFSVIAISLFLLNSRISNESKSKVVSQNSNSIQIQPTDSIENDQEQNYKVNRIEELTDNKVKKQIKKEHAEKTEVQIINQEKLNQNIGLVYKTTVPNTSSLKPVSNKFHIPPVQDVCLNEKIKIENINNENLIIIAPNKKQTIVESNKTLNFIPTVDGEYQIAHIVNEKLIVETDFNVKTNQTADFIIDNENSFNEKELPTVLLKTTSVGNEYNWMIDGKLLNSNSKEVEAHLYKKGNYTATLIMTHQNGCKSKESKSIRILKDYNLLAVDAFEPMSSNSKLNTFIPFALTKRDVRFTMIIFDVNGNQVYKTSDANEPWNGIDSRSNESAKSGSIYVWKVIIENPEEGEKGQYGGSVIIR